MDLQSAKCTLGVLVCWRVVELVYRHLNMLMYRSFLPPKRLYTRWTGLLCTVQQQLYSDVVEYYRFEFVVVKTWQEKICFLKGYARSCFGFYVGDVNRLLECVCVYVCVCV